MTSQLKWKLAEIVLNMSSQKTVTARNAAYTLVPHSLISSSKRQTNIDLEWHRLNLSEELERQHGFNTEEKLQQEAWCIALSFIIANLQ